LERITELVSNVAILMYSANFCLDAQSGPDKPQSLPSEWDLNSTYAFRYKHSQSSMEYLLKVSRLGGRAVIFGIALGDDRTTTFDISVRDYVSESAFPFHSSSASSPHQQKALQDLFISPDRITDLSSLFNINIIHKLAPGLGKSGSEEEVNTRTLREIQEEQRRRPERQPLREDPLPEPVRPYPYDDPLAAAPRRPAPAGDFPPPGFEDEHEINRPPRGPPAGYGGRRPLNIGERDLYPQGLGPHDPLGGSLGPGVFPRGGGGGMHPTLDDPLFGGGQGEFYDPRAPPGARYDPVGPGDGPPNLTGGPRFPGGPGGGFGGSRFGGGFGGDII
jgi:hypothetical protein